MVYRQLQLASLALGLLSACQTGEPTGVSIALQLDRQSCGVGAENLQLVCGGTLWIHVAESDGSVIDNACVELVSGGVNFSELGPVLGSGIDLGTLPGQTPLRISLAVFAETLAECPTDQADASPIIFGQSSVVQLSEASEIVPLALACLEPVGLEPPLDDPSCDLCNQELAMCLEFAGASSCQSIVGGCLDNCGEGSGCDHCALLEQRCQQGGAPVTLNCDGLGDECVDSCLNEPEPCAQQCFELELECNSRADAIAACEQESQDCSQVCGEPGSSCLALR